MGKLNVGNLDRAFRVAVGTLLMVLAATGQIGWWGYFGVILVLTGMVALCPLYSLLGWKTTSR